MQPSEEVKEYILDFYRRLNEADPSDFEALIVANPAGCLVVGTGPDDWITDAADLKQAFVEPPHTIDAGEVEAWEDGHLGWLTDTPSFGFSDGSTFPTRVTAILRKEGGSWRMLHSHFSVGIPDEEAIAMHRGAKKVS